MMSISGLGLYTVCKLRVSMLSYNTRVSRDLTQTLRFFFTSGPYSWLQSNSNAAECREQTNFKSEPSRYLETVPIGACK